jgi:AcrR family transcriptional regulator
LDEQVKRASDLHEQAQPPKRAAHRMPRAERHVQLLSVAREIISAGGIGALTMSALAERSGAAKPIVYGHFTNSEDVAIALLREHFNHAARFVVRRLKQAATIYEYFDIVIDGLFDYYSIEQWPVRSITNGFSSTSEVNQFYLDRVRKVQQVYVDLLEQQGLASDKARVAAYALMEMIRSTVLEFAPPNNSSANNSSANNRSERETLKTAVRAVLRAFVGDDGAKPMVPRILLEPGA